MTLEELKNIEKEIIVRNRTSQKMIKHCFIYSPTLEDIKKLLKMGIQYQYCNDSLAYIFSKARHPNDDMLSFLNLKLDIHCNEDGFESYTLFAANIGLSINDEPVYLDIKEHDIIGIIYNKKFGYKIYEPCDFYWSIMMAETKISTYQNVQMLLA